MAASCDAPSPRHFHEVWKTFWVNPQPASFDLHLHSGCHAAQRAPFQLLRRRVSWWSDPKREPLKWATGCGYSTAYPIRSCLLVQALFRHVANMAQPQKPTQPSNPNVFASGDRLASPPVRSLDRKEAGGQQPVPDETNGGPVKRSAADIEAAGASDPAQEIKDGLYRLAQRVGIPKDDAQKIASDGAHYLQRWGQLLKQDLKAEARATALATAYTLLALFIGAIGFLLLNLGLIEWLSGDPRASGRWLALFGTGWICGALIIGLVAYQRQRRKLRGAMTRVREDLRLPTAHFRNVYRHFQDTRAPSSPEA